MVASFYVNEGSSTNPQIFVEFNIERAIGGKANDLNLRIHNLSESSRNAIGNELITDVQVEAGYIPNGGTG